MAPEILKRKIKDGWGVTHERGTQDVKRYYFEKINNNIINYRLELVFSFTVFVSMFVCLLICFVVLFRFYSLFVCIYCLCYVTVLYQFFFESIVCVVCVGVPVICLWYTPNSTNLNKR
jgi:ABC-type multidrug transport system permease subunit